MKENVKNYELGNLGGIGLYVGTYKKYNEGNLYGMWIDLEWFTDASEFFEICRELHSDEEDPEFMFQDFQCFPEKLYSESMGEEEIQRILDFAQLSETEQEKYEAYCNLYGIPEDSDDVENRYVGYAENFEEFCKESAEDFMDDHNIPDCVRRFFNYEKYENEMDIEYCHTEVNGTTYVFS